MKLVTVEEMRAIEAEANAKGLSYAEMMERAGEGVAEAVSSAYSQEGARRVLGLVGPGNNGGDALVALTRLADVGWSARAYLVRREEKDDSLVDRLREAGGEIALAGSDTGFEQLRRWVDEVDVLIDGLLGTGIKLPLRAEVSSVLATIKEMDGIPPVVAVDCPSGVDCDSGEAAEEALPAEMTVCMAAVKTGLLQFPAATLVGDLVVVDLGFPSGLETWEAVNQFVVTEELVRELLPDRPDDAHKGTFGTATLAVGSVNYTGAALLAGEAAYRSGAGLVRLAVPSPLYQALAGHLPEAIWLLLPHEDGVISGSAAEVLLEHLDRSTALLLGCGWGREDETGEFLAELLGATARIRSGMGFLSDQPPDRVTGKALPPLIIDADGLRLLAALEDWPKRLPSESILTPHPGEMAALTGLTTEEIQQSRIETARRFASEWGQVVVLKGANSVVAAPNGKVYAIPVATAALARAGTGDVLAGLITGLRAQGLSAVDAAIAGCWIHAQAGLLAEEMIGSSAPVLAGDVLAMISDVFNLLEK